MATHRYVITAQGPKYYIDGEEVTEAKFKENNVGLEPGTAPNGPPPGNWPLELEAGGVAPEQRREAEQAASDLGVPTKFTDDGVPIMKSRAHMNRFLNAHDLVDRR